MFLILKPWQLKTMNLECIDYMGINGSQVEQMEQCHLLWLKFYQKGWNQLLKMLEI